MKKLFAAILLSTTLLSTEAFARPLWPATTTIQDKKPKKQPTPEQVFISKLSDFHRKRFATLSPEQKSAALRYFNESTAPDQAIEQVIRESYTIR